MLPLPMQEKQRQAGKRGNMRHSDPRLKLLFFLLISITAFCTKDIFFGSLAFACVSLVTFSMGQVKTTLRFILAWCLLLFVTQCAGLLPAAAGIALMLTLCIRMFLPLLLYAKAFTATTGVSALSAAMHRLRVPRQLVLAFSVALRFFPTAKEEFSLIRDAMTLRGIGPTPRNIVTRPGVLFEGVMMPVMMRAAVISEELAASSVSRGIDNPEGHTSFEELRITARHALLTGGFSLLFALILAAKYLPVTGTGGMG